MKALEGFKFGSDNAYDINLLTCSKESANLFLEGQTIVQKLVELRGQSIRIDSMYTNVRYPLEDSGTVVFVMSEFSIEYNVTVSLDDFNEFSDILKDYETLEEL